jgi:hypothetical protein
MGSVRECQAISELALACLEHSRREPHHPVHRDFDEAQSNEADVLGAHIYKLILVARSRMAS